MAWFCEFRIWFSPALCCCDFFKWGNQKKVLHRQHMSLVSLWPNFLLSPWLTSFHLGLTSRWSGSPVPSSGFRRMILLLSKLCSLCCWKGCWEVRFLHLGPMCSFWHPAGKEGLFVNQKDFLLDQWPDHHSLFLLKGCSWICFSCFPVAFKSFQKLLFLASQFSPNSTWVSLPW